MSSPNPDDPLADQNAGSPLPGVTPGGESAERSEKLVGEYLDLIDKHGTNSQQVHDFLAKHGGDPAVSEWSRTVGEIDAKGRDARRRRTVAGLLLAVPLVLVAGLALLSGKRSVDFTRANQELAQTKEKVAEVQQERDRAREGERESRQEMKLANTRELARLLAAVQKRADVSREDWLASLRSPDDLPLEPSDQPPGPPGEDLVTAGPPEALEGIARMILDRLEKDQSDLERLRNDSDPSVREGVKLALDVFAWRRAGQPE